MCFRTIISNYTRNPGLAFGKFFWGATTRFEFACAFLTLDNAGALRMKEGLRNGIKCLICRIRI